MRQTLAAAALGATSGPRAVLSAQLLLVSGLAATVALGGAGLSPAGWAVGVTCGLITNAALTFGRSHYCADRLTRADWVTLARAAVAFGVAALVVDSFGQPVPVTTLVALSALALALDAVDGWVARHTRTREAGSAVRRRGRRVPDPRPQRVRGALGGRVGARDRGGTLRVPGGRLAVAMDARAAAAAVLAKGRRGYAGDRPDRRGRRRPACGL